MIERKFVNISKGEGEREAIELALLSGQTAGWPELLHSRRIMLFAEAGSGKTHECKAQRKILWEAGEPAFFLELAELANAEARDLLSLSERERLDRWYQQDSGVASFFLDSFDELRLSRRSFRSALVKLERLIEGRLGRARIVVTSRPIPFDEETFREILPVPEAESTASHEQFARIAMGLHKTPTTSQPADWRTVRLLPLSNAQVLEFARLKGVKDPEEFFNDIRRRGADDFARRPLDLEELCALWNTGVRTTTLRSAVGANVYVKLQPHEHEVAALSGDKALEGASRLALSGILTRKRLIRYAPNEDASTASAAVDPRLLLADWTPDEQATLLQRPLFSPASYGVVRFHHRSVQEFLASEYIASSVQRGMSIKPAKRLLFGSTPNRELIVKPSMRAVAAWLAGVDAAIFEELLKREPVLLLTEGDPSSLTPNQRQLALEATINRYGAGGWQGLQFPELQARRFVTAELATTIRDAWSRGIENPELRDLLLALIEYGKLVEGADLAYAVANDKGGRDVERLNAIDALLAIDDPRLRSIARAIVLPDPSWSPDLARWAFLRLFPRYASVVDLCTALPIFVQGVQTADRSSWAVRLSDALDAAVFEPSELHQLRGVLASLIQIDSDPHKRWPSFEAQRASLVAPLAVICEKLLTRDDTSAEVLRDACIALRVHSGTHSDARQKHLRDLLGRLSAPVRRKVFEVDDALMQQLVPSRGIDERVQDVAHGPLHLQTQDSDWVREVARDSKVDVTLRTLAACLMPRFWDESVSRVEFSDVLRSEVSDLPEAMQYLAEWGRAKPDERWERMQREHEQREERRKAKEAQSLRDWQNFAAEVVADPDVKFGSAQVGATVRNLWVGMDHANGAHLSGKWDRLFVQQQFNSDIANRLRIALMDFWRAQSPQLPCERAPEKRNEYPQSWLMGLTGIAAESEDPEWAKKLSVDETIRALRYVPWHLNGFPAWLDALARDKPEQVQQLLGQQLNFELTEKQQDGWHSATLQNLRHAPHIVAALFIPQLLRWLEEVVLNGMGSTAPPQEVNRLEQVLGIIASQGDAKVRERLVQIAASQLPAAGRDVALAWMRVLLRENPMDGVAELERRLAQEPPAPQGEGATWIAALFGDAAMYSGAEVPIAQLPAGCLARLVRLAYEHVRVADDVTHTEAYTPDTRDKAERGRSSLLSALLNAEGTESWEAKLELARDPLFQHVRSRIVAVARNKAAEEADATPYTEYDLRSVTRTSEVPPATASDMHMLLQDRLDDIEDMLLRDHSPREAWAKLDLERLLRREIARELHNNRREAYTVDQEGATADEKETDIRLRSPLGPQGVIELKVAEKGWTAEELRDTIANQLVARYMADEQCRSGCLVLTVADSGRKWNRPGGGTRMNVDELRDMLEAEARRVERNFPGEIRIDVRILDLSPRLLSGANP